MNTKHYPGDPIKFEITKIDMEKIMYNLNRAIGLLALGKKALFSERAKTINQLGKIREDLQHKINQHIKRGEWK